MKSKNWTWFLNTPFDYGKEKSDDTTTDGGDKPTGSDADSETGVDTETGSESSSLPPFDITPRGCDPTNPQCQHQLNKKACNQILKDEYMRVLICMREIIGDFNVSTSSCSFFVLFI